MIQESFSDYRLPNAQASQRSFDNGLAPRARALIPFKVLVRREDSFLVRVDVLDSSRFLASRQAEETLLARDRMRGVAATVVMDFDPHPTGGIGEECQGPCEFTVVVVSSRNERAAITVWARSRQSALELARERSPASFRPILASVRYRCLGRCLSCGVTVFQDVKHRQALGGWKCFDCN